jgi:hypothetical protein
MKNKEAVLLVACFFGVLFIFFGLTGAQGQKSRLSSAGEPVVKSEEAAIKAVIEGEIKASFEGDYNRWSGYFIQEPYTVWMQSWKEGYVSWKGWQEIGTAAKGFVKPERKGTIIHNGNYDYTIRIYDHAAFISFKCKSTRISGGQSKESEAMEVRFLEKYDGNWKIAYLGSLYLSTYDKK